MTTLTLDRPGRRPGALIAANLDPRPCVTNPPQMWDVGNDGNAEAMRLCGTCPFNSEDGCEIGPGTVRRGIPWSDHLNPIKVCKRCGHPRIRKQKHKPATCKCPDSGRTREQIVQACLDAGGDTRSLGDIATEIGVEYHALRDALRGARRAGDRRVPLFYRRAAA